MFPFKPLIRSRQSWVQPSRESDRSPVPSTMSTGQEHHGPAAHEMVREHVRHERHPHSGEVYAHRTSTDAAPLFRRPETQSESLEPSDPRPDPAWPVPHPLSSSGTSELLRPSLGGEFLVPADPTKARFTSTQQESGLIARALKFLRITPG